MTDLIISKKNEVYLQIDCEPHIQYELRDAFTFEVPGAKFHPSFRKRHWDGNINLFSPQTKQIYVGLLDRVVAFCEQYGYSYEFRNNKFYGLPYEENESISPQGVADWVKKITSYKPRDYQLHGIYTALKANRKLIVSPTASGKSLMIYALVSYYSQRDENILIVVPTTSLVEQMYKDFEDYGFVVDTMCHKIYGGKELNSDKQVTITTWQSIYKLPKPFFQKFSVVIGDEAHNFKSKSLVSIMSKLCDAKYRFGFTGTLDGCKTHKWVLEGLFGTSYNTIRTKELMEAGHVAKLDIKVLLLKYNEQSFNKYEDEIQFLISNEKRNKFIRNLALDLKGNTLILFSRVENHGKILYDLINNKASEGRQVFFVHGGIDVEEREKIREITEREDNAIIIASYGVFSTGINIKSLHNVIFASPSKSRVRNLQSIGRVLRKGNNKSTAMLYDIADDTTKNGKKNYTLNHLIERIKIYNEEKFNYDIINIIMR
jgi:superfamily II DNA or RNA helicase